MVFIFAAKVPHFDFFSDRDAHGDQELGGAVDSNMRLDLFCLLCLFTGFLLSLHYLANHVVALEHGVVEQGGRFGGVTDQEEKIEHEVGHF